MTPKCAILASHPVQYQVPLFRELERQHPGRTIVYFCAVGSPQEQARAGYGTEFQWDVDLYSGYPYRTLANAARQPDIHRFSGLDTPDIEEEFKRDAVDALVLFGWHFKAAIQAALAARRAGIALLARSDSVLESPRRPAWVRLGKRALYPALLRRVEICLPAGRRSSDYFRHYDVPRGRIVVVPHAVDERLFGLDDETRSRLRNETRRGLGVSEECFAALFVGRLVEVKRPVDFVQAVSAIESDGVVGLVVGDGPLRRDCEEAAVGAGRVRFLGFRNQTELPAIYAAADVLVLTSESETWGLVLNEAMAAGTPCVITTGVAAAGDLVVSGATGEVFEVGDVTRLSAILRELAVDQKRHSVLSRGARAEAGRRTSAVAARTLLNAVETAMRLRA